RVLTSYFINHEECTPMRSTQWESLADVLQRRAAEQPDRPAFIFLEDGETCEARLSYEELDRRARAIAANLQQQQLAGERILLALPTGLDFIAAFFGCLYAGAIAVPLQVITPSRMDLDSRFRMIAEDCQAAVAITKQKTLNRAILAAKESGQLANVNWMSLEQIEAQEDGELMPSPVDPEQLAILQYTSGSTAHPRGVRIAHRHLI